jgi:hypothetical protein
VPVFATKVGGIEDYLKDGVNGFAVRRNASDIAEKIAGAFSADPGLRALRAGALATASAFGWEGVARKYIEALEKLEDSAAPSLKPVNALERRSCMVSPLEPLRKFASGSLGKAIRRTSSL